MLVYKVRQFASAGLLDDPALLPKSHPPSFVGHNGGFIE
jgi:hypothetical protein